MKHTHFDQVTQTNWYSWLSPDLQLEVREAHALMKAITTLKEADKLLLENYNFLVFPMAIIYEGFLKQYLLKIGLISKSTYESRRFRIGRAINPDVRKSQRDEQWLYDDLERSCGTEAARYMWETWLECRNRVFHYFPGKDTALEYHEAIEAIEKIESAMQQAVACRTKNS